MTQCSFPELSSELFIHTNTSILSILNSNFKLSEFQQDN